MHVLSMMACRDTQQNLSTVTLPNNGETSVLNRFENFATDFVVQFESQLEVYRACLEWNNPQITDLLVQSLLELAESKVSAVKTFGLGYYDSIKNKKRLNIAGKMVELLEKFKTPEQKQSLRKILIAAAFELFKSFEYQFMNIVKTHGGWHRAILQMARAGVWNFFGYYIHNAQDLNEQFIIEGVTLKLSKDISWFKKFWYSASKNFSKVHTADIELNWNPDELFSQIVVKVKENEEPKYLGNDYSNPKFGYRLLFPFESEGGKLRGYNDVIFPENFCHQVNYNYKMISMDKKSICESILVKINATNESVNQEKLTEDLASYIKETIERLFFEYFYETKQEHSCEKHTHKTELSSSSGDNFCNNIQNAERVLNIAGGKHDNQTINM